jgi:glycosyltransferase involved in cell wall biosynthesis
MGLVAMYHPSRISAVMPAYNSAGFIHRAITSVWKQTQPVDELIVVDDGSSDGTAAVVRQTDSRTNVVWQSNAGPGAARNRGVRESAGDWLAFIDADDAWRPDKIERQVKALGPETDVVFCYVVDPLPCHSPPERVTFDALWKYNCVGMSTAIIRRSLFESIGGFDEDRSIMGVEDYNLWLRLTAHGARFRFVPEQLVEYTPAPGNLSSQYAKLARCAARNIEKVAQVVPLDPARVKAKLAEIYEEYGVALLHDRDLPAAREFLREALRHKPDHRTAVRWLSTFAPRRILDLRRSIARSFSTLKS